MDDVKKKVIIPSKADVTEERERLMLQKEYYRVLRNTIYILTIVAAVAVLVATLYMPTLQVSGSSMSPTLAENDVIVLLKHEDFKQGDLIAFSYNNKVLLKRVIAQPGSWVDITKDGDVLVNDLLIDEPYLTEKAKGECNIKLPYQVPDGKIFVMGDHRATSIDSRSKEIGCIDLNAILGKVFVRIWPLNGMKLF